MDGDKISYELNENHTLTSVDNDIVSIINDNSIIVNMQAEKGPYSPFGGIFVIDQFGGNTITTDNNGKPISVNAFQVINPSDMNILDASYGTPGVNMMYELYEAYLGGQNALKYGLKGKPTNEMTNSAYKMAHDEAIKKYKSSPIIQVNENIDGKPVSDISNAVKVMWYYSDVKNNKAKILKQVSK